MGIIYPALASAAVLAWFGPFANHALKMRVEKNFREMWGAASLSLLPAAVFCLFVASGDITMLARNYLLLPAGALLGACVFAYAGYLISDLRAGNAPPPSGRQKADEIIMTQNGPSINTWNQSGGTNTINIGPTKLTFADAIAEELVSKLPVGKPISLQSVGSASDQAVADQYQQFLQSRGFHVAERNMIGMMAPPPDQKISILDAGAKVILTISPSAN